MVIVRVSAAGDSSDNESRQAVLTTLMFHDTVSQASIEDVVRGQKLLLEADLATRGIKNINTRHEYE